MRLARIVFCSGWTAAELREKTALLQWHRSEGGRRVRGVLPLGVLYLLWHDSRLSMCPLGGLVISRESKITSLFLWKGAKGLHREFHHHKVRQRWVCSYMLTFFLTEQMGERKWDRMEGAPGWIYKKVCPRRQWGP